MHGISVNHTPPSHATRKCSLNVNEINAVLGIHFDSDLASSSHVNALIRTMYLELRYIVRMRAFTWLELAKSLSK